MTYAAVKSAIVAHCSAAGATLTPPLTDVAAAFPWPAGRCIRVYYGGEDDPPRFVGRTTLGSEMIGKATLIAAFFPLTLMSSDLAAAIDTDMEALSDQLRSRLTGDATLGGACIDSLLEYAEPNIVTAGNTRYAMVMWRVLTAGAEYTRAP